MVYPPTLVLIVLALFGSRIRRDWVFRLAALGAVPHAAGTVYPNGLPGGCTGHSIL